MKKALLFGIICLIILIASIIMLQSVQKQGPIRKPQVAGAFYPAERQILENQINGFLEKAMLAQKPGKVLALIVPHAGYQFSGGVAAYGYKTLKDEKIDTVILIGNSHHEYFEGVSIFPQGFYQTPLGKIEIDADLAEALIEESDRIFFRETAHAREHCLEVQLPFLQKALQKFKIVPIIFGSGSREDYKILAQALLKHTKGKDVVFVASSDLSHYPPGELAQKADLKTLAAISTGSIENLESTIQELTEQNIPGAVTFACGLDAIKTVMQIANELGADKIEVLKYQHSGDVSGDMLRVVGYGAVAFYQQDSKSVEQVLEQTVLSQKDKEELLQIAKLSLEGFVKQGKVPEFQVSSPALNQKLGAFVTLKKHGALRGCIGRFSPTDIPLYRVVSEMAIAAGTKDLRFYPVSQDELPELDYEISVLSNLEKVDDWREIEIGKHGVQIEYGTKSGVFLPQVATENNWNLETFLGQLCFQKLNLPWNCWKSKEAKLYIFTAEIFSDKE